MPMFLSPISSTVICKQRTVGFTIAAQVVSERRASSRLQKILQSFKSRNRHILKCSSSFQCDVDCHPESLVGWQKLWRNTIFSQLKPYGSLKRLGFMGIGGEGGGVLLTFPFLKKLTEALPNLETLSLVSCVFLNPDAMYFAPIGSFKHSATQRQDPNESHINDKKKLPVFPNLKTLRIDQSPVDFIVRPEIFPNLERIILFLAASDYFPGRILSRFSNYPKSKLTLFTYGPKRRAPLKFHSDEDDPPTELDNQNLIRFLRSHENSLETFFWQPFPTELVADVVRMIMKMRQLKRFAICESDFFDKEPNRLLQKICSQLENQHFCDPRSSPGELLCRNLEYLFLGSDAVPDLILRHLILQNCWTLKTLKLKNCSNTTVQTLKSIENCQILEVLSFTNIENLTDTLLKQILTHAGFTLKVVGIRKCHQVTRDHLEMCIRMFCPQLTKCEYE